jgi:hypothetical protein
MPAKLIAIKQTGKTNRQNKSFPTDSNLGFACLRLDEI